MILQATVAAGSWPWIVGGLVAAIVGMAGWFGKLFMEQRKAIEAQAAKADKLHEERNAKIDKLYEERIAGDVQVAVLLEKATATMRTHEEQWKTICEELTNAIHELRENA